MPTVSFPLTDAQAHYVAENVGTGPVSFDLTPEQVQYFVSALLQGHVAFQLNTEQTQRLAVAVGQKLGLLDGSNNPRPATKPEARQFVIALLREFVQREERVKRMNDLNNDIPFDVT